MQTKNKISLTRKIFYWIMFLAALVSTFEAGAVPAAYAQSNIPSLFTNTNAIGTLDIPQAAIRTRSVGLDLSVLSGPQGDVGSQSLVGSTIQMNLFPDTIYNVTIDSIEASASGGTAWNGHIDGISPSYAYLIYTKGVFTAHVASLEGVYEVQYAGEELYTISQLDQSLYPDDIVLEPELPADALPPVDPELNAQSIVYIDVMVVYTSRAVTAVGGVPAMNAKVDLAVQEANQSYINSNVNQRLNLVYKGLVTYDEGVNPDFEFTLDDLTGKDDGYMDNIHSLRDTYKADLVNLMIEGSESCGIANLMSTPSISFKLYAFSVVAQDCATGYYSFAHELGHNMGSRHDTYMDTANTPYSYSHGFTYPAANWRTIMAYNDACEAVGKNCVRLQYWSNPSIPYGGTAMGNSTADNHTSLNNTAATVAAFRVSSPASDDNYEQNNTLATAYDLSSLEQTWLSTINGYGKQADADWYRIYATPGSQKIIIDARFTHSQGDIDIDLCDSSGFVLATSQGTTDNEYITYTVPTNGTYYYIKVYYGNAGNQYNLWWDNVQSPPPSAETSIDITIGGNLLGNYDMSPGTSDTFRYSLDGGPVEISSTNGVGIIASLDQWRRPSPTGGWTGVAQSMALPYGQISNSYAMPYYNGTDPTLYDAVLMANVDTVPRTITVTIGGVEMGSYLLGPSDSRFEIYNVTGGPLVVSSVVGSKIVASLYELKRAGSAGEYNGQSEMMGLPATQLSDRYLIPIYFGMWPGYLDASLYFANVDTISTTVDVTIAGVSRGTYVMPPKTSMVVKYALDGGPVEISSNNGAKIVASLNQWRRPTPTGGWTGVAQSMALPVEKISNSYVIPIFDGTDSSLYNAVLMANVDTVPRTITVKIGKTIMGSYLIGASDSRFEVYNVTDGPIVVSSVVGAKIVASLYELKRAGGAGEYNGQSEMMGLPISQLSDKYLIPIYFGMWPGYLLADLYIGVP